MRSPRGMLGVIGGAVRGLTGAALVAAVVAAAVWPVWYLATAHTGLYTVLALTGIVMALAWALFLRLRRREPDSPARRTGP